jgi:hypothetical protein
MTAPRLLALPILATSLALAGCGISDPYTHPATTSANASAATTSATATMTVTDPSEPPPSKPTTTADSGVTTAPATASAATPRKAVQLYARLYINWTAKTIGSHQRQLAGMSEGTARAAALQAAASYGRDQLLQNSDVANTGTIVSIAAGQGPERGDWVIVTSERTTGQGDYVGLPAAAHATYAHVTHTHHGWVVNQWSPQN